MPAFNISCSHKYLVIKGIEEWKKCRDFSEAKTTALLMDDNSDTTVIYEKLGRGKRADWFSLAEVVRGTINSLVLGDLPTD